MVLARFFSDGECFSKARRTERNAPFLLILEIPIFHLKPLKDMFILTRQPCVQTQIRSAWSDRAMLMGTLVEKNTRQRIMNIVPFICSRRQPIGESIAQTPLLSAFDRFLAPHLEASRRSLASRRTGLPCGRDLNPFGSKSLRAHHSAHRGIEYSLVVHTVSEPFKPAPQDSSWLNAVELRNVVGVLGPS